MIFKMKRMSFTHEVRPADVNIKQMFRKQRNDSPIPESWRSILN